jgi:protoporphyrinogen oxidase
VFQKHDRVGGLVGTFESNGFSFDAGPRAFVNSGIVKPILRELGIEFDFLDNVITLGVEDQLFRIHSMDDLQEYQRILVHLYPENRADIEQITAIIRQLSEYTRVLYEFDNPNFVDLKKNRQFVF